MIRCLYALLVIFVLAPGIAAAEKTQKNLFASVLYKGDKIGHVHLTMIKNEKGEIEGLEVYGFDQNLKESWDNGELQAMSGKTDDNGTPHEISLNRDATGYKAVYNKTDLALPLAAFPTSPWHYQITENKLLFNIVDFELLNVKTAKSNDTVKIGGKDIATEKFDFTGDWKARLWFDANKEFVKGEYDVSGRQVTVILDPE